MTLIDVSYLLLILIAIVGFMSRHVVFGFVHNDLKRQLDSYERVLQESIFPKQEPDKVLSTDYV